jgi:hypothetical protein
MPVPVVINSLDEPSYPKLTGGSGNRCLYEIFKQAAPLIGATIAFDNTADAKLALHFPLAQGGRNYLQLYDSHAAHGGDSNEQACKFELFSSMSDVDTGTDPLFSGQNATIPKNAQTFGPYEWILISDGRTVLFFSGVNTPGDGSGYQMFSMLDFVPALPTMSAFNHGFFKNGFGNPTTATNIAPQTSNHGSGGQVRCNGALLCGFSFTPLNAQSANTPWLGYSQSSNSLGFDVSSPIYINSTTGHEGTLPAVYHRSFSDGLGQTVKTVSGVKTSIGIRDMLCIPHQLDRGGEALGAVLVDAASDWDLYYAS